MRAIPLLMPIEPATSERDLQRRYWRLAAVLFIGGGLARDAQPTPCTARPTSRPSTCCRCWPSSRPVVCWLIADRVTPPLAAR